MECLLGRPSENQKTKNEADQEAGPKTEEGEDVLVHDLFLLTRKAEVKAAIERRKRAKTKNLKKTAKSPDLVLARAHVLEVRKAKNPTFGKNLKRKKDDQRRRLKQE
jgi:hypothetical protein